MGKLQLSKPTLFMLYGFPGSGKTYFGRQLCDELQSALLNSERIRLELFNEPQYDKQENQIVKQIMFFMAEEFLGAGMSVVFDAPAMRGAHRRELRNLATKNHAESVLVWQQIDIESAFARASDRDRRKFDDKYTMQMDRATFDRFTANMQNPVKSEEPIVVSGKHTFKTQYQSIIKRLYDKGLIQSEQATKGTAKPGLVNLIPNPLAGRVDPSRRNISIK